MCDMVLIVMLVVWVMLVIVILDFLFIEGGCEGRGVKESVEYVGVGIKILIG